MSKEKDLQDLPYKINFNNIINFSQLRILLEKRNTAEIQKIISAGILDSVDNIEVMDFTFKKNKEIAEYIFGIINIEGNSELYNEFRELLNIHVINDPDIPANVIHDEYNEFLEKMKKFESVCENLLNN